jgi:NADH-quinone oxidoreductase subunit N
VLAMMASISMLLGNLVAIRQTGLRRLLAYSAIAHAGTMLLAIVAHTEQGLAALLYYVVTYALATLGTFGVIAVVEEQKGGDDLSNFDGLGRQAPVLSFCLAIFILSLAGIPPLAGFFAKFYLFVTVLNASSGSMGLLWLVVLAIAMSAVALYYYLRVLKRVYVAAPAAGAGGIHTPILSQALLLLLAASIVLLGCAPQLLLRWIEAAIQVSGL